MQLSGTWHRANPTMTNKDRVGVAATLDDLDATAATLDDNNDLLLLDAHALHYVTVLQTAPENGTEPAKTKRVSYPRSSLRAVILTQESWKAWEQGFVQGHERRYELIFKDQPTLTVTGRAPRSRGAAGPAAEDSAGEKFVQELLAQLGR